MMERITNLWKNLDIRMPDMGWPDVVEILIIAFLMYHIMAWIKNTRAWALLKAILIIFFFLTFAAWTQMNTILWIAENVIGFAVTALIVVLQPELRIALEELGNKDIIASILPFETSRTERNAVTSAKTVNEIAKACVEMGKVKTGALIVIQQKQTLSDFERTGIEVDGIVTSQLLINIFEHNTPLHDGAIIINGNRVTSATCYLPLSDNLNLDKNLGTRHRAGLGISEVTDALTIIVSEETGKISVTYKGEIERNLDMDRLKERLRSVEAFHTDGVKKQRKWKGWSRNEKETTK